MESLAIFGWATPLVNTLRGYNCGVYEGDYGSCIIVKTILNQADIKCVVTAHAWEDYGTVEIRKRDEKAALKCLSKNNREST